MKKNRTLLVSTLVCSLAAQALSGIVLPVRAAEEPDTSIRLYPARTSPFNDTDGDGLGEFQGWGTSLCWWANRIGSDEELTKKAAAAFYSPEGLDLNIGRYNLGGGDHVTEEPLSINPKASIYDMKTPETSPSFSGSSMEITDLNGFENAKYRLTDKDLGILAGESIPKQKVISWISDIQAAPDRGSALNFSVHTDHEGEYTIKLVLNLIGDNSRSIALQAGDQIYTCAADSINKNVLARSGNNALYLAEFDNVKLSAGDQSIVIGGSNGWCLDFVPTRFAGVVNLICFSDGWLSHVCF